MERFPVEVLYIVAFVAIVLFNLVMQRAARRREQEQAQAEPPPEPSPAAEAPLEDIWGRTPVAAPAPLQAAPPPLRVTAPPAPRPSHPVRMLLKDRRDLRRAVVLMMVLGPCRAQEPPEG